MTLTRMKQTAYVPLAALLVVFLWGCGSEEPADTDTSDTDSDTDTNTQADGSFFPLTEGNEWIYESLTNPGKFLTKVLEKREPIPDDPEGRSAYVLVRTESDDPDDLRRTYIDEEDGMIVRYRKEWYTAGVIKTIKVYDPYFLRIDPDNMSTDDQFSATFTRTDYDETGAVTETDNKVYNYTVISDNEQIEIDNGETLTCVHLTRTDTNDGDTKDIWYAPGVGKVKEEGLESATGDEELELLVDYTIQ